MVFRQGKCITTKDKVWDMTPQIPVTYGLRYAESVNVADRDNLEEDMMKELVHSESCKYTLMDTIDRYFETSEEGYIFDLPLPESNLPLFPSPPTTVDVMLGRGINVTDIMDHDKNHRISQDRINDIKRSPEKDYLDIATDAVVPNINEANLLLEFASHHDEVTKQQLQDFENNQEAPLNKRKRLKLQATQSKDASPLKRRFRSYIDTECTDQDKHSTIIDENISINRSTQLEKSSKTAADIAVVPNIDEAELLLELFTDPKKKDETNTTKRDESENNRTSPSPRLKRKKLKLKKTLKVHTVPEINASLEAECFKKKTETTIKDKVLQTSTKCAFQDLTVIVPSSTTDEMKNQLITAGASVIVLSLDKIKQNKRRVIKKN